MVFLMDCVPEKETRDVILDSINDGVFTVDGEWRISVTGYERIFEYRTPMHADSELVTRWSHRGGQP